MREAVFASSGAHDTDTSNYELSDLKYIEFFWAGPRVELDAAFKPESGTTFWPTAFNDIEMEEGGPSKNPIVLDEEEDKQKSPILTPVSDIRLNLQVAQKLSSRNTDEKYAGFFS